MRISIIGGGVVGTEIGRGFAKLGNDVIFYDIDEKRVKELKDHGLKATTDIVEVVKNSEISFITVPTPTDEGKINLSYIKSAITNVANTLKNKNDYHLIVVKSTVVPGTVEKVVKPLIEEISGKTCGKDFGLCMNPEFLTEINKSWSEDPSMSRGFFTEDRIVIGQFDKKSGDVLEELYKKLDIPIFRTDLKTAELIKYAANCCLASRISYWNEIFYMCNRLGIDSNVVAKIVSMDKRIGKYGTIHGMAFGGKCFPKDLQAFIALAEESGYDPIFLKAVRDVNEKIKKDRGARE